MTKGSVKIVYHNENADCIVASAGRISTTKGGANDIYEKSCEKEKEKNIDLINKIVSSGHTSVLEHVSLNLAFDNVSVFVEQFMIEFRLASFTVKSRRYVDFGKMGFVMPDFERYGERTVQIRNIYQKHMEYLFREYNDLLMHGIPKEDARFVLPYSFRSNFYCTVNARELIRIVNEMVWGRGKKYPEVAALGKSLIRQCESTLPFLHFGESLEQRKENRPVQGTEKKRSTPVRDDELVVLLNGPVNPEEIICRAEAFGTGEENWRYEDADDIDLQKTIIKNIISSSRKRELEQVNFTILFQKVSLAGITHLVRHRMQSIIIPEYIHICDFENYIVPDSIVRAGLKERYEMIFLKSEEISQQLRENGLAECDQVYLMLSGLTVPVMTTMNANELFTFIRLRSCNRAQWEIRENAIALLKRLREKYPVLFSLYGPACYVTGVCPEGKMSCGQSEKMRKIFSM